MTKSEHALLPAGEGNLKCRWCRRVFVVRPGPGRPKQFCSQRCRQWDWVSRQRAADLALGVDEIIIRRDEFDRLHDDLFVLACAVGDVERDLAKQHRPTLKDVTEALEWLLDAAKPLVATELSAPPTPLDISS